MIRIGQVAPNFIAPALMPDGQIQEALGLHAHVQGKKTLLVFYPLDFTFVCPSELLALEAHHEPFQALGVTILGISIDSVHTHRAWCSTSLNQGGVGPLSFPLVSDLSQRITQAYGFQHLTDSVALRASVLLDEALRIRHLSINDLPLGRHFGELIRLVQALNQHEKHGLVCPAQWSPGRPAMSPSPEGVMEYLTQHTAWLRPE